MRNITFLITTYNRKDSCQRLVDSIKDIGRVIVVGDNVDYTIDNCNFINLPQHNGKPKYWSTVRSLFSLRGTSRYYMMLPDDFLICESQIDKAIETWEGIKDPLKICLNLYTDRVGKKCWTSISPIDKRNVWQTGWVDMCFLCEDSFFRSMVIRDVSYDWWGRSVSSGVGAMISRQLVGKKLHLYQVKESLVTMQPEHIISQLHDKDNLRNCEPAVKKRLTNHSGRVANKSGRRVVRRIK